MRKLFNTPDDLYQLSEQRGRIDRLIVREALRDAAVEIERLRNRLEVSEACNRLKTEAIVQASAALCKTSLVAQERVDDANRILASAVQQQAVGQK